MDKIAKIKKLADAMYYAAQYLTTDASRLHKAMDEYHKFIIHEYHEEEPVSEELEEEIQKTIHNHFFDLDGIAIAGTSVYATVDDIVYIAKHFDKWQKQQDQSTIELAEDHAMLAGMEKMKEEMMKDAIDAVVHIDAGGYPYIPQIELWDYDKDETLAKEGDKYKVVLIKEE